MRVIELFAGIGLMRAGLERAGWTVVFANDIEPFKASIYVANYGAGDFHLGDVRSIEGNDLPDADMLTASFPCTDLSLAGNRAGLGGEASGMFWEAVRLLTEMKGRRPHVVLFENVPSFATSLGGQDFLTAVAALNRLGYLCDPLVLDAASWVPQSRRRLLLVGVQASQSNEPWAPDHVRPSWLGAVVDSASDLGWACAALPRPPRATTTLASVVERLPRTDVRWWSVGRTAALIDSMSPLQRRRLESLKSRDRLSWRTAFRRTRNGVAVWEARADEISGCLRTAGGGSSRQALIEIGRGSVRVRWMTPVECARLQGAEEFVIPDTVTLNQALFAFGDAVCVPAVEWLANEYLNGLVLGRQGHRSRQLVLGVA